MYADYKNKYVNTKVETIFLLKINSNVIEILVFFTS